LTEPAPRTGADRDRRRTYWAMDFVHDQLQNGRKFRMLTIIDK
jgi:hypothetical protein